MEYVEYDPPGDPMILVAILFALTVLVVTVVAFA